MNRYEFLTQLEEQLRGFVSNQEVKDSVSYYQSYIEEEMKAGRTEEEILDDLGSANSIAKAIIEARGHGANQETVYDDAGSYGSDSNGGYGGYSGHAGSDYSDNSAKGRYGSSDSGTGVKIFRTDGWKGTAVLIGIIAILVLLLVFAFKILIALIPFIIPCAIIVFLIKMVTGRR